MTLQMEYVPILDPKTRKPQLKKTNHRTYGTCYGFECRLVPLGADPEAAAWTPRLAELVAEMVGDDDDEENLPILRRRENRVPPRR